MRGEERSSFICMWVWVCVLIKTLLCLLTPLPFHIVFSLPFILAPLFCSLVSQAALPSSQLLCFIIHSFHPSSSIAFNISLFTSLSFWRCLINMLAVGSKKRKKNGDKHQTHAFFFVWGGLSCKRWVTLEKANRPRSHPPHPLPSFLCWPGSGGN